MPLAWADGLPGHPLRQGLPLQQLHNDEVPAFVLLDRVNGADVGVIEGGSGARLALEALERLAVLGHFRGKKLQGHAAAELRILGFVHHTHAARAQLAENLVMQERLADEWVLVHIRRLMVFGAEAGVKEIGRGLQERGRGKQRPSFHGSRATSHALRITATSA
jgi:hypothetical protein